MLRLVMFTLICGMLATPAFGQTGSPAVIFPAAPTDQDPIHATFSVPGLCQFDFSTVVDGTTVKTTATLLGCILGPPAFPQDVEVVFGPLPAGTYTYEIYLAFDDDPTPPELLSRQTLVVAATIPGVPTLSETSLLLLLGLLATAGVFGTRQFR